MRADFSSNCFAVALVTVKAPRDAARTQAAANCRAQTWPPVPGRAEGLAWTKTTMHAAQSRHVPWRDRWRRLAREGRMTSPSDGGNCWPHSAARLYGRSRRARTSGLQIDGKAYERVLS